MPERTSYAHGTPSWIDLSTTDPDDARRFYGALFGWEFDEQPTDQGGTYIMATKNSKAAAGMMQQPPPQAEQGMPPMWLSYVTVDNLETTVGKAGGAGGQILMPAMDVMEAGKMAVIGDPTGSAIALWEPKARIGAEIVNEHGALIWNELMNSDVNGAMDFYSQLFGWTTAEQQMPFGPYTLFNVGEDTVGGAMAPPMPAIPNHWAVYFGVDDIEASISIVAEQGGTVLNGPMDIGIGKIAAAQDPQGASFHLMQPMNETS